MAIGLHSQKDWGFLKKKHNYCCAECGDSEQSLHLKWGGTWKSSLTKDHIIPLSRGGSDNIDNIQPLCVSCNSSKHSKVNHKIVCVSGGMDFLHIGHVDLIEDAARFGKVVVILNSDEWLMRKKNYVFMPFAERAEILLALRFVSAVAAVDDADDTVCEALRRIKPDYFANGGDRVTSDPREQRVCLELGIKELFGIGGGKISSSSELLRLLLVRLPEETAKL
jgi:D-beta-D-heptose 7-phosphate kinase/D-beta-D-heptose 1-phosphate adenosyltransferase